MISHLVVGADSRIGSALCDRLGAVGTTRRHLTDGRIFYDLCVRTHLPAAEYTYFCAGMTSFKECADNPDLARKVNVFGPVGTAFDLVERGGKVILLSSCAAETHPETVYGQLKLEAEKDFLHLGNDAAVFRFGPVKFPGRTVYPCQAYHPIELETLLDELTAPFVPGLHRLLNTPVPA